MKQCVAVLSGLLLAVNIFAQDGELIARSGSGDAIIDDTTGVAAATGVLTAGLYWAPIGSTMDANVADDGVSQLIATTDVRSVVPLGAGHYIFGDAGTVVIPGTAILQDVLVQVRAWSTAYGSTYAEVLGGGNPQALVGASEVLTVTLGGGTQPRPSIAGPVASFTVTLVPEPSTIVLGLVGGLGALLLLRRRQ